MVAALALLALAACSQQPATRGELPTATPASEGAETSEADAAAPAPGQPFTIEVLDNVRLSSRTEDEYFQRASSQVDWGEGPFASVKLNVELETDCFPFEKWRDNPPPAGHNYPESCDAFDRNFDVHITPGEVPAREQAFEVVHAITPFGGPMSLSTDITDLANARPGKHTLQAYIATWSDAEGQVTGARGGWDVTVSIEVTPGPAPREVLAAIPLLNRDLNHDDETATVAFDLPAGTNSVLLEYRASGHGGGSDPSCFGPADEFCQREHQLFLDSEEPFVTFSPFRNDCATLCTLETSDLLGGQSFCLENPTGLPASVRSARANWCPGDETEAYEWQMNVTGSPSEHQLRVRVPDIADGGHWRISATAYALSERAD